MAEDERGTFDEGFDVTEDDFKQATTPPKPWPIKTAATATVKSFLLSDKAGASGFKYFTASLECVRADGGKKTIRDSSLSLSPKAKGKFVQFCNCFGVGKIDEINAIRRGEYSPVGLQGNVTVGQEDGQDGNTYNRIGRYNKPQTLAS